MNTTTENENNIQNPSAASAPSAISALNPDNLPSPGRPLSRLSVLSERQLEHVHAWIKECVPSRKISEFCRKDFQKEIPHMTFVRYAHRFEPFRHLDGLAESKEAAKEISHYAATGNPSFSTNTLELLEQQAFDLALAHNRDADAADLHILEKLWTLIHKAKNTQIRERHATVQEQKVALRREELELKRQLATARLNTNNGGTRSPSPTSFSRDAATPTNAAPPDQETSAHVAQNFSLPFLNPTSFSRDEITSSNEISANKKSVFPRPLGGEGQGEGVCATCHNTRPVSPNPNQTHKSEFPAPDFSSICSLSPEVRAENQRYAELLLSGQIETHYKRDPKNSLLAKICNWPAPCSADSLSASANPTPTPPPAQTHPQT